MSFEEIMYVAISVIVFITIITAILTFSNPDFLEAKTMSNEIRYISLISDGETKVKFNKDNEEFTVSQNDYGFLLHIDEDAAPIEQKVSKKKVEDKQSYILLS